MSSDLLHRAEEGLARLRRAMLLVAVWVNNPAYDDTARRALAELLGIPAPRRSPETTPEKTNG